MLSKTLTCVAVLVSGVLVLAGTPASADEKDKPALSGSWVQNGGELKIEFSDKDVMTIFPHGENKVIVIVCKYTVEKGGRIKAKITEFDGKEEAKEQIKEKLPLGLEFSFKWTAKADTATLDDLKGDKIELLKAHLESKYDQKK